MKGGTVYRIQDKNGRGPWKPGFSHLWVEDRPDHENLPPWFFEFGPVHLKAFTWEHLGSGCRTVEQLQRWFTESEYRKLLTWGYQAVKIEVGRVLAESDRQVFFARKVPLCCDLSVIDLY